MGNSLEQLRRMQRMVLVHATVSFAVIGAFISLIGYGYYTFFWSK